MATTIRFTLFSAKEIEKARQQLIEYQEDLNEKLDLFVRKLCEKGVEIARENVKFTTGELYNSIDYKPGDVIQNGSQYLIYTDCEYAKFVEFGTGVKGDNTYPTDIPIDWDYASGKYVFTNSKGETGWYFPTDDGSYRFTQGQEANAFMYKTSVELREIISEVAKEVFGGASDDISD